MSDRPSKFLEKPPRAFDEQLPIITERDLQELQEQIPELTTFLESSSINVSMKDETGKASFLQSEELENLVATPQFPVNLGRRTSDSVADKKTMSLTEMSSSEKATQMSMDASTQVEWTYEEEKTPVQEEQGTQFYATQRVPVVNELTNVADENVREETTECLDDNESHESKKSSSDTASEKSSALDDSDLVFRSAHEDYVTVFDADLAGNLDENDLPNIQPVGELQEDCTALLDDASQTPTLASSGTQSTEHSTQTERSSDSNLPIQESGIEGFCEEIPLAVSEHKSSQRTDESTGNEMIERLELLKEQLRTTQGALESACSEKEKFQQINAKVGDCCKGEFEVIRQGLSECRQVIVDMELKIKEDVMIAVANLQQKGDLYRETVIENTTKRTREEFERELAQINAQFEQERTAFLELQSKLKLEKSKILEELKQLQEDKETSESQHQEESARLSLIVSEYKAKIDEREGAAQKLQESKSRYEEDQQIRFNAIMMKLKREKENALSQAQEKIKELKRCVKQQEEDIKTLLMEKEKVTGEYEQARDAFCGREQELLAGEYKLSFTLKNLCFVD